MVLVAAAAVSDSRVVVAPSKMATLGLSKVFILDKYFTELQKFWETEKKLQGKTLLVLLLLLLLLNVTKT
uniref:Uncharacterized protein n=1 Tax=Anopheles marajoara TaxID=58244 RepID=A0A2M4C5J8_9DIPT